MASIRKRGSNSYLIVVSRGYDYEGNRLKSVQKTVKPPKRGGKNASGIGSRRRTKPYLKMTTCSASLTAGR